MADPRRTAADLDPDRERRLYEILGRFHEEVEAGGRPDSAALVAENPELAAELADYFAGQSWLGGLVGPGQRSEPGETGDEAPTTWKEGPEPAGAEATTRPAGSASETTVSFHPGQQEGPIRAPSPGIGRTVGDYDLFEELGRGGMGVVFRARQRSLDRPVAIKMLLAGALAGDSELRRFRAEAEAVARLDHPNIVPIYEVGCAHGLPFFSMRLVEGGSLSGRVAGLANDPRVAARLAMTVAEAIHHAHQRGLLHRDLKPGNILVDPAGQPHVTDFGLAMRVRSGAGDGLTGSGAVAGTPGYMAPEQAGGRRDELTTATDVYGLGAILFAMLAGRAPFVGDSLMETLRQVCEREPTPPSRLNPRVGHDLETICLKCLEKEPKRRYGSALALAEDLGRYLRGEPVAARPVGPATRLAMWCRRRPAPAALAAGLAASMVAGAAGVGWNWLEVRRQKALLVAANADLVAESDAVRDVNEFLGESLLANASPDRYDAARKVTVEELLDRASEGVGRRFARRPAEEATIRRLIGNTYHATGALTKAGPHLERALGLYDRLHPADHPTVLAARNDLGCLRLDSGDPVGARPLIAAAWEGRRRVLGESHRDTLTSLNNLAAADRALGRPAEAERELRRCLELQEPALGTDDEDTLKTINNLGALLHDRGRSAEAADLFRRALEGRERRLRVDHPETLSTLGNLAAALLDEGDVEGAIGAWERALAAGRRVRGEHHPATLATRGNLGAARLRAGDLDAAESHLRAAWAGQRENPGEEHPDTVATVNNLAMVLVRRGKLAEAEAPTRAALESSRRRLGPDRLETARLTFNLGSLLADLKRPGEAVPLLLEALPIFRAGLPPDRPERAGLLAVLGRSLCAEGRPAEAEPHLREALELRRRHQPAGAWTTANAESLLGGCLADLGRDAEAEGLLIEGYERMSKSADADPGRVAEALDRLVRFYEAAGLADRAAAWRARRPAGPPTAP